MSTTGPFVTANITSGSVREYRRTYRSQPPFANDVRPALPYLYYFTKAEGGGAYTISASNCALLSTLSSFAAGSAQAINRAYSKFRDSVNEEAMLLVNAAERKQAINMVTKSANRMLYALQLCSSGRRAAAMKALGLKQPKSRRFGRSRDASGMFLEMHFGWEPLIKDIYSAIEILESPYKYVVGEGKGGSNYTKIQPNDYYKWSQNMTITWKVRMGAFLTVTNPNLSKASQLGLINPATVAWELIPWSFLVDWFVPVSQFLGSSTDFVGLTLRDPYTTIYGEGNDVQKYTDASGNFGNWNLQGHSMRRSLGIASPTLHFTPPRQLSMTRGFTAISLLAQQLGKTK